MSPKNEADVNSSSDNEPTVGDVCRSTHEVIENMHGMPDAAQAALALGRTHLSGKSAADEIAEITTQSAKTLKAAVDVVETMLCESCGKQPHHDIVTMISSLMRLGFVQVYRGATDVDRN